MSDSNVVPITEAKPFPFKPLGDIVVISQSEEIMSAGGIMLVGKERKFPSGYVVAVGPGRVYTTFLDASGNQHIGQMIPTTVKVGDYVVFGKYASGGEPLDIDGKIYVMAREGDLAGVSIDGAELKIKLAEPKDGY